MPFVLDRLERVNNDFVDFHFNEVRPDFVLTLRFLSMLLSR
jgi:hypothetical protein